jgi:hypothetical protein
MATLLQGVAEGDTAVVVAAYPLFATVAVGAARRNFCVVNDGAVRSVNAAGGVLVVFCGKAVYASTAVSTDLASALHAAALL